MWGRVDHAVKEMNSIVYVAELSSAEHLRERQSIGSALREDELGVGSKGEWGGGELVKDLWVLLSHFASLSLTPQSPGPLTCAGLTFLTPLLASGRSIDGSDFTLTQ